MWKENLYTEEYPFGRRGNGLTTWSKSFLNVKYIQKYTVTILFAVCNSKFA